MYKGAIETPGEILLDVVSHQFRLSDWFNRAMLVARVAMNPAQIRNRKQKPNSKLVVEFPTTGSRSLIQVLIAL